MNSAEWGKIAKGFDLSVQIPSSYFVCDVEETKKTCQRVINAYVRVANKKLSCKLPAPFTITFDLQDHIKWSHAAGLAESDPYLIRLNLPLLLDNLQTYLDHVIPHEIAHIITFETYTGRKARGHGVGWRTVMSQLGKDPDTLPTLKERGLDLYLKSKKRALLRAEPKPTNLKKMIEAISLH